jgi:hypothetical protein
MSNALLGDDRRQQDGKPPRTVFRVRCIHHVPGAAAFVRWQESEAGKDFRWVEKDGQGEAPGGIDIGFG